MHTTTADLRLVPPRLSLGVLAGVLLIHAGILAAIFSLPKVQPATTAPAPLLVRLIETQAPQPTPPAPQPPPKLQPPPRVPAPPVTAAPATPPRPQPEAARPPAPVESARLDAKPAEPQPAPTAPAEAPKVAPAAPLPVTQPRFNADYLDNPKPPYPSASRRMGEEGEVRLRVQVDPAGNAQQIEVAHSSGFPRLDQAALDTVKQWRFIPARQGDQPISAWVIVPIKFSLNSV